MRPPVGEAGAELGLAGLARKDLHSGRDAAPIDDRNDLDLTDTQSDSRRTD